jgi:hypothetical protein
LCGVLHGAIVREQLKDCNASLNTRAERPAAGQQTPSRIASLIACAYRVLIRNKNKSFDKTAPDYKIYIRQVNG